MQVSSLELHVITGHLHDGWFDQSVDKLLIMLCTMFLLKRSTVTNMLRTYSCVLDLFIMNLLICYLILCSMPCLCQNFM